MTAAVAAAQLVRHRRALTAAAITAVGIGWTTVMAIVVVAMGGTPAPADLAPGPGIPPTAMDAYLRAASTPSATACGMRWQILAGVGRVESNHASGRAIAPDGTVAPPIIGPVLDGTHGTGRVLDTDHGTLDGDTVYDHAVGPMQFLPSTWQVLGVDGNGDGVVDPNNIYDAAAGAVAQLCGNRGAPLSDDAALAAALYTYNHSDTYVTDVEQWIHYYDQAATGGPSLPPAAGNIVTVRGIAVDASVGPSLDALLAAADDAGLTLGGTGYRTRDEQIALRRAHCGTTDYAVFEMPADRCSPPTARPGESLHESGLAIDFTCNGVLVNRNDGCFSFLAARAPAFGLFNLSSEPWHWSTNGR